MIVLHTLAWDQGLFGENSNLELFSVMLVALLKSVYNMFYTLFRAFSSYTAN